jgi:multidrug efflux pump subunit AcrB
MFWPGIMGEFMGYLPLTLIMALSASLFVALVINPVLSECVFICGPGHQPGALFALPESQNESPQR